MSVSAGLFDRRASLIKLSGFAGRACSFRGSSVGRRQSSAPAATAAAAAVAKPRCMLDGQQSLRYQSCSTLASPSEPSRYLVVTTSGKCDFVANFSTG